MFAVEPEAWELTVTDGAADTEPIPEKENNPSTGSGERFYLTLILSAVALAVIAASADGRIRFRSIRR